MEFDELDDLYRDTILNHCRHPRNQDVLEDAHIRADGVNPFCGDEIHLQLKLDESGRVAGVGLQGKGCSINQATGSMMSEALMGKTLPCIEQVADRFKQMMQGKLSDDEVNELGDLKALQGVRQFPVRIKCALLAWFTLEEGLEDYRRGNSPPSLFSPSP